VINVDKAFLKEKPIDSPVISKLNAKQKEMIHFEEFTYSREAIFDLDI